MIICPHQMTVGDFNNDGNPDVATAHTGTKALSVLFGDGTATFPQHAHNGWTIPTQVLSIDVHGLVSIGAGGFFRAVKIDLGDCGDHKAFPSAVEAADLNHDKLDDLVVGLPGQLAILRGLGDGEARS